MTSFELNSLCKNPYFEIRSHAKYWELGIPRISGGLTSTHNMWSALSKKARGFELWYAFDSPVEPQVLGSSSLLPGRPDPSL